MISGSSNLMHVTAPAHRFVQYEWLTIHLSSIFETDHVLQEICVREDCMTVTMSHKERRNEQPTNQSESTGLGPGVHVVLQDLTHATVTYGDESWTNPSLLNGATGIIIRRDQGLWIVELDQDLMVRLPVDRLIQRLANTHLLISPANRDNTVRHTSNASIMLHHWHVPFCPRKARWSNA